MELPSLCSSIHLFTIKPRKIFVNGKETHEIFRYLRLNSKELRVSPTEAKEVPWNFGKFLLDADGNVLKFFNPDQKPNEMISMIEPLLKK